MKYKGSCHCGGIAFEAEGEIKDVLSCNCSMCQRKGSLLWFIPRDRFRLLTPERDASTYTFNKHFIKHRFCGKCGIHPYAEAADKSGQPMAAINVRCLEGVEPESFPVKHFNGRAL
ncbi:MAG TPA: GFA family protein [Burkholderiales bacterium]